MEHGAVSTEHGTWKIFFKKKPGQVSELRPPEEGGDAVVYLQS